MKKKTLKAIAYLQLLIVAIFFLGFTAPNKGTIVYPILLKQTLYAFLALLSSVGIIFNRKSLFISMVYLYTFLIMEKIEWVIFFINADKVNYAPDVLRHLYIKEIIIAAIFISFYIAIVLLVVSKKIRDDYKIQWKLALKNLVVAAVIAFFIAG